ncbi:pentapeptide repeat-containing protein [Streptomyces sp. C36]|uniref:pentapeptide repeat-containing protein n=1 Tax=Streptomyces sp. C36 TaxID=3237122 RepID=UPI0034C67A20
MVDAAAVGKKRKIFLVRHWKIAVSALILGSALFLAFSLGGSGVLTVLKKHVPLVPLILFLACLWCGWAANKVYRNAHPTPRTAPPIRWWWVAVAVAIVVAAVWVTTAVLLSQMGNLPISADREKQRVEVVRTGLAAGAGAGAALTVLLAFRRQHHHEQATRNLEKDADERRITELFTKAVEQLGSSQAPVRMGALYSLERVGRFAPDHRQTVMNVVCAYLRMPYTPPPEISSDGTASRRVARPIDALRSHLKRKSISEVRQELEVRVTAQRILAQHLQPGEKFWERMHVNLSNATLVDFTMHEARVTVAHFSNTTFIGTAFFRDTVFGNAAFFMDATFGGAAHFGGAKFGTDPLTEGGVYRKGAFFDRTLFSGYANFRDAIFKRATFTECTFGSLVEFSSGAGDSFWFGDARVLEPHWKHSWPSGWGATAPRKGPGHLVERPARTA